MGNLEGVGFSRTFPIPSRWCIDDDDDDDIYIYDYTHTHINKYIYISYHFFRPRSMNGFSNRPGFWSRIFDIFRGKGVAIRSHLELLTSLSKWYDWYDPNAEWLEGITLKMAYFHLFPVFSSFGLLWFGESSKKKSRVYPTKQRALSPGWQEVSAMCRLRRAARLIHEGLEGLEASSYQESYLTHVSIFVDGWWLWAVDFRSIYWDSKNAWPQSLHGSKPTESHLSG